ncbi:MAG: hypothetical protein IJ419_09295 [Agathobacter sp.]|nr:hypothetical protein [Agathobacter sp.]
MKKMKNVILLICFTLFLVGCSGSMQGEAMSTSADSEGETSNMSVTNTEGDSSMQNSGVVIKEVVFVNKYCLLDYSDLVSIQHNEYRPFYEWEEDADTLYAFQIRVDNWDFSEIPDYPAREEGETDEEYIQRCYTQRGSIVKALLQKEGFIFVVQETSGNMVVAATREQMERVFVEMESLGSYYLRATAVIRPDMEKIMVLAGWDGLKDADMWYEKNEELLKPLLGTDAAQVTLKVPVILPDEEITE